MDTSKAQPSSVPVQESRHAVEKDTTSLSGVPDAHLPSTEQRLERVFRFDTSRYNFRQIIFDIFCTAPQVGEQLRAAALQDSNDIGIALSRVHEVQNKFWQSRGLNSSQAVPSQASSSRGGPPPLHKNNNSQQQEPCKKIPRHDPKAMKKKASKKCAKKLKKSSFYSAYVLHTSKRCSPKKVDGQAANNVLKSTSRGPASSADCPTSRKAIGATAGDTSPADVATNSVAASVSATGHFEDLYSQFHSTLKRFVREVVAPLLGVGADDVLYQRYPTLRISPPASTAMGHAHIDADYHHQPAEVNFWIPLTRVFGTNTLFVESAPSEGDYHPIELKWGQGFRFWGNQVRHYTVPNSENATRVSLDFRCIASPRFNPDHKCSRGRPTQFRPGEYFALSAGDS